MLWLTWSDDAGKSWAEVRPTPLWGFPPHLARLSDGRILCTYGHRRPPYGQRACVSEDGLTWHPDGEVVLRDDADNGDLGYPASIEIAPGRMLTVYYQVPSEQPKPWIWGTHWELPSVRRCILTVAPLACASLSTPPRSPSPRGRDRRDLEHAVSCGQLLLPANVDRVH